MSPDEAGLRSSGGAGLLRKLLLVAGAAGLLLILLEIAARVYVVHWADQETFVRFASLTQLEGRNRGQGALSPHRYLGYYPTPGFERGLNRHNALGFRGEEIPVPKPDGELRIVCLGGSTTYTTAVEDYRLSYPDQLQRVLRERGCGNVRVINGGLHGWSSWESLINFQFRVLDLEPDLVIVYHGVNDVHPRLVWPPEAYRGDNSGTLRSMEQIFMPKIWEYSTLVRMILVASGRLVPHASLNRTLKGWARSYHGDAYFRQQVKGVYPRGIFAEVSAEEMLAANPPLYFERNLLNLAAAARAHGCETVLATFAWSGRFDEPRSSSAAYDAAYTEMNRRLLELGAQEGIPVFDLAAAFPDQEGLFVDGRHVTAQGAALKAELLADYLLGQGLVSLR